MSIARIAPAAVAVTALTMLGDTPSNATKPTIEASPDTNAIAAQRPKT